MHLIPAPVGSAAIAAAGAAGGAAPVAVYVLKLACKVGAGAGPPRVS